MCVLIRYCSTCVTEPWDPTQNAINISPHLEGEFAVRAVRAVLSELHVEQPQSGAVCWCGVPVCVKPPASAQRHSNEVMTRGA